jgi:hypothetical protein
MRRIASSVPKHPEFKGRFDLFLNAKNLTKGDLAVALDTEPSAVSNWGRRNLVPAEKLAKLAALYGLSLDWLLLGKGTMLRSDLSQGVPAGVAGSNEAVHAPLLLSMAQMRDGSPEGQDGSYPVQEVDWPVMDCTPRGRPVAFHVEDDDMQPIIRQGWLAGAELWDVSEAEMEDLHNALVLVDLGSCITIRWLVHDTEEWRLRLQNPKVPEKKRVRRFPLSNPPKVIGRLHWWFGVQYIKSP